MSQKSFFFVIRSLISLNQDPKMTFKKKGNSQCDYLHTWESPNHRGSAVSESNHSRAPGSRSYFSLPGGANGDALALRGPTSVVDQIEQNILFIGIILLTNVPQQQKHRLNIKDPKSLVLSSFLSFLLQNSSLTISLRTCIIVPSSAADQKRLWVSGATARRSTLPMCAVM